MNKLVVPLLLLGFPVLAQQPTAAPQAAWRDRLFMRIEAVGPAAFRAAFLPTNIGSMLASDEGERLWRPLLAPGEQIWRQWDGGTDFAATRRRILDYGGAIRFLRFVHPHDEGPLTFSGMLVLQGDGRTDMKALAEDLARPLRRYGKDRLTKVTVGARELEVVTEEMGDKFTVPIPVGDDVVAFLAEFTPLQDAVAMGMQALAPAGGIGDLPAGHPPLRLHIDIAHIDISRAMNMTEGSSDEIWFCRLLGTSSLDTFTATVQPVGPHAQLELSLAFRDGERGIWNAVLPPVQGLPELLARLPAEATPWFAAPLHLDRLYHTALQVAAAVDKSGTDEVRKKAHEEVGFHADTELLDHMGGEVLILGDLWQTDDPDTFRAGDDPPLGACVVFSLKNAEAFAKGLDKLLDQFKGTVSRFEAREVEGVTITRLGSAFLTGVHMAVGADLFALAFGEEGVAQLEALVTGGEGVGAAREPPLPASVQRVRRLAPGGWNGVGVVDLQAMFGGQVTLVLEMLEDSLPREMGIDFAPDDVQEWLDMLLPLVERHHLEHLVMMSGFADSRWQLRLVW